MSDELKACRDHWQHLPPHVKERMTAQCLHHAIEVADRLEAKLKIAVEALEAINAAAEWSSSSLGVGVGDTAQEALAKIKAGD